MLSLSVNRGLGGAERRRPAARCDETFQDAGPGSRKDFHSEECRRSAERDLRRTFMQLAQHVRQAEQLRARVRSYTGTQVDELVIDDAEDP